MKIKNGLIKKALLGISSIGFLFGINNGTANAEETNKASASNNSYTITIPAETQFDSETQKANIQIGGTIKNRAALLYEVETEDYSDTEGFFLKAKDGSHITYNLNSIISSDSNMSTEETTNNILYQVKHDAIDSGSLSFQDTTELSINENTNISGDYTTWFVFHVSITNRIRTITFSPNGGTLTETSMSKNEGDTYGTLPTPTKVGYDFIGWYTEAEGGTQISESSIVSGDINLYAHWVNKSNMLETGIDFRAHIPTTTTDIQFITEIAPSDVSIADISAAQDNGVVGWLDGTTFKVSTQRDNKKIVLNPDSAGLFNSYAGEGKDLLFPGLKTIDLTNTDASQVTNFHVAFQSNRKLTSIVGLEDWNTNNTTNMGYMFNNCQALTSLDISKWDTSKVQDMSHLFGGCNTISSLNILNWNTSACRKMTSMFKYCQNLKSLNLSNWNVSKVVDMAEMFKMPDNTTTTQYGNFLSELDVSHWDVSNVQNTTAMFYRCYNLNALDTSNWNLKNVINTSWMFKECTNLTSLNVSNMNMHLNKDASYMFYMCNNLAEINGLENWDTSSITNMKYIFGKNLKLKTLNFTGWNTSNVTDMSGIFWDCAVLTKIDGLNGFDTDKVTTMSMMFTAARKLAKVDVSSFNTSNVTNMYCMFSNANSLEEIKGLTGFDTSKVTDMCYMFAFCNNLTELNLSSFDTTSVAKMDNFTCTTASSGKPDYKLNKVILGAKFAYVGNTAYLPNGNKKYYPDATGKWKNKQTGMVYAPEEIPNNTEATYVLAKTPSTLVAGATFKNTIPDAAEKVLFTDEDAPDGIALVDVSEKQNGDYLGWLDETTYKISSKARGKKIIFNSDSSHMFDSKNNLKEVDFGTNVIDSSLMEHTDCMFIYDRNLQRVTNLNQLNTANVTSFTDTFFSCSKLQEADVSNFDTSKVKDMFYMFYGCGSLETIDVSKWDTSNVNSLFGTFFGCSKVKELDVSNWNTSKVTNMINTFNSCGQITSLDISHWDTSSVTSMDSTFSGCGKLEFLDTSNWNVSNVTCLHWMFVSNNNLSEIRGIEKWDTSNVTDMESLFFGCGSLKSLDLSAWNTEKVTTMARTFYATTLLQDLNVKNWNTKNVTTFENTFGASSTITTLDLSDWDTSKSTNFKEMFNYTSSLETLDISNFNTKNATAGNMDLMFGMIQNNSDGSISFTAPMHLQTIKVGENFEMKGEKCYLPTPMSGYVENGNRVWYDLSDDKEYKPNKVPTNHATTYAATRYAINYINVLDSELSNTVKKFFYKNNNEIAIPTPSNRSEFEFVGWYDNEQFAGEKITKIPANFNKNITLYAKWHSQLPIVAAGKIINQSIPENTKTVLFTNEVAPANTQTIDLSDEKDGRILGWTSGDVFKISVQVPNSPLYLNTNSADMFKGNKTITTIDFGDNINTTKMTNMERMFNGVENLKEIKGLQNFDTQKIESLNDVFAGSGLLTTADVSNFNTSNVKTMRGTFYECKALENIDVSLWDTNQVTDMFCTFYGCYSVNELNVSNWNTDKVTNMEALFSMCKKITTLDLRNFNTSKVTSIAAMFHDTTKLAEVQGLENFDVSNVTTMALLFQNANSIKNIDLSKWDTSNVTNMGNMFVSTFKLKTLNLGGKFTTENVPADKMEYMFGNPYENVDEENYKVYVGTNPVLLEEITLSNKFEWKSKNGYLHMPNRVYLPGANKLWYDKATGYGYDHTEVPSNNSATYTSIKPDNAYYSVWYDVNGGSDIPVKKTYKKSGETYGNITTPTREKFSFDGWYTDPKAGTKVESSDKVTTDIKLYAHWVGAKHTVNLDPNGGTSPESVILQYGDILLEKLPKPTHSDKVFDGWYTEKDGGTKMTEKDTMPDNDLTLYAHWRTLSNKFNAHYWASGNLPKTTKHLIFTTKIAPDNVTVADISVAKDGGVVMWSIDDTTYVSSQRKNTKIKLDTSMQAAFYSLNTLETVDFGNVVDTSAVENMWTVFYSTSVKSVTGMSNWDTSKVKEFCFMFYSSSIQEIDISSFTFESATKLDNMIGGNMKKVYVKDQATADMLKAANVGASSSCEYIVKTN